MSDQAKPPRFPRLPIGDMTPEQRAVADHIVGGKRMEGRTLDPGQSIPGPFNAWLQSPRLADALQVVGEFLRFETSLPGRLSEFAILITARHWTAQFEWFMHRRMAVDAGLAPAIADAIAEGRRPEGMQPDETAVYDFCTELRRDKTVSDATFNQATALFGQVGAIELVALSGYYDLVSMTLNVAEVRVPRGQADPLQSL